MCPSLLVSQMLYATKNELMVPNQPTYVPYDIMVIAFNEKGQAKGPTSVYTGKMSFAMSARYTRLELGS